MFVFVSSNESVNVLIKLFEHDDQVRNQSCYKPGINDNSVAVKLDVFFRLQ